MNHPTTTIYERLLIFIITLLLISCSPSTKKNKKSQTLPSLIDKLYSTNLTQISLVTDLQLLLDNKMVEGKHFQPAFATLKRDGIEIYNDSLKIRPRGITRRTNCSFPPIMIKTSNKKLKNYNIGPSSNIKLVTHCEDSVQYSQWVQKEYLVYKMLNLLTPESFNAQKVEVIYTDSRGNLPSISNKGFMIEPFEELSDRISCPILDDTQPIKSIHKEHYKLITLFQFMIGNTDWNLSRRHNIRLLNCNPEYGPKPVPYDFDFSGFVNATYAKPHPMLPIKNVRERMLQWRGDINEDFSGSVVTFNENRSAFFSLIQQCSEIEDGEKESCISYLEDFYKIIESPVSIKKAIQKARSK